MADRLQAYLDRQAVDLAHLQDQGTGTFGAANLQRALVLWPSKQFVMDPHAPNAPEPPTR